jgi:hypothetical protein
MFLGRVLLLVSGDRDWKLELAEYVSTEDGDRMKSPKIVLREKHFNQKPFDFFI